MSYQDIKKKYGKTASERSSKIKLAKMKVERMQALYDAAYEDWREAANIANKNICEETSKALHQAAGTMRRRKERLEEAKREYDTINVSSEQLENIVSRYGKR